MPNSVRIRRHELRARSGAPGGAVAPDSVADGLADALRGAEPVDRPGLWLIRRLDVRLALAAGTGSRAAARSLAVALVRELDRALDAGTDDAEVRWFPDRAALLEQWLVDLRSGSTGARWEYNDFAAGSKSAAIRQRAQAQPADLLLALRRLPGSLLDELVDLLAPADAAAIAHAMAQGPDRATVAELVRTSLRLAGAGRLPVDARRATLLLFVEHNGASGPADAARARDLALVAIAVRACPPAQRSALLAALREGDWAGAGRLGGTDAAAAFASWSPAERASATAEFAQPGDAPSPPEPAERGHTPFGGQFLLLPLLGELPLSDVTRNWPQCGGVAAVPALAALAICGVLGAEDLPADPYLRLALGLGECTFADLAQWADGISTDRLADVPGRLQSTVERRSEGVQADLSDADLLLGGLTSPAAQAVRWVSSSLLRELSYRLPGMAAASAAHLRRNVLAADADVIVEEERIVVELGHPPLNLLLSLTGMNRRSFTLLATGDRPWILTTRR